jgi:hypothetical protein
LSSTFNQFSSRPGHAVELPAAPASMGSSGHARAGSGRRDYVLIEQQADFVAWWDSEDGPGSRHGLNRFTIDNADRHSRSVERAEEAHRHQAVAGVTLAHGVAARAYLLIPAKKID